MNKAPAFENVSPDSLMGRIADEFLERLNRGEQPQIEEYARRYPQMAPVLRQVLPALQVIRVSTSDPALASDLPGSEQPATGCLGDYRMIREVGRGGMGVVYEAEQISLSRRVALKVLPFAAALDAKQLQRFKNEAQAAAHLHHTHIVPVYAVGCERGVHYYAMQFIEGQTLADVIRELHEHSDRRPSDPRPSDPRPSEPRPLGSGGSDVPLPHGRGSESTSPVAVLSTERSTTSPAFFRTVAQLSVQAAEALEHAHSLGIIHRDIKPANLLVETKSPSPLGGEGRGEGMRLWITDFGLAQIQRDTRLTMSGDVLGTLRYMSPEQALAKRQPIDHRTDIYSLGATLYELLTLEPAIGGQDREEILRHIAFEEPRPPKQFNPAIPTDLETIVLKAMAKEPAERYDTAQELADDLLRFLEDQPIRAKRPTWSQRVKKWTRRHRPVIWAAVVSAVVVSAVATAISTWQAIRATRAEEDAVAQRDAAIRAETRARELEELLRTKGPKHPETKQAAFDLARDLEKRGILQGAADTYVSYEFWPDAARTHQSLMQLEPRNNLHWWRFAIISLALKDHDSYRQTCKDMLDRFGDTGGTQDGARVAWTCALQPAGDLDLKAALILAEEPLGALQQGALGAVLFRMGRFPEAVEEFEKGRFDASPKPFVAIVWCFRGMAYNRIGEQEKARQWLEKADQLFAGTREKALWNHQVLFRVIREEAAKATGVPARGDRGRTSAKRSLGGVS